MAKSRKMYPWQYDLFKTAIDVINDPNNQVIAVKAKRQLSKSSSMALIAVWAIQHKSHWCVGFCSPSFRQARKEFLGLKSISEQYEGFSTLNFNDSRLEISDKESGSLLQFISGNQDENLRGGTYNLLILDECAYLKDSLVDLLMPTRIVNHAPLIVGSTPLRKKGRFYEFFSDPHSISLDWNEYDTSSVLSDEVLDFFRARLAPALFKTDYEGEFLDSGVSVLFGNLKDAILPSTPPFNKIYVGIDAGYGTEKDYTSVVGLNEFGQEVFVEHLNKGGISAQEIAVYSILTDPHYANKIQLVHFETNALGTPMLEHIKQMLISHGYHTLASKLKSDYWTHSTKATAFTNLIQGFGTGTVKVLDIDFHIDELENYGMKVSSSGVITYGNLTEKEVDEEGLGRGGASHDDSVCALAHAYSAFMKGTTMGRYTIG